MPDFSTCRSTCCAVLLERFCYLLTTLQYSSEFGRSDSREKKGPPPRVNTKTAMLKDEMTDQPCGGTSKSARSQGALAGWHPRPTLNHIPCLSRLCIPPTMSLGLLEGFKIGPPQHSARSCLYNCIGGWPQYTQDTPSSCEPINVSDLLARIRGTFTAV